MTYNTEEITRSYKPKHNLTCENQVILFMITDNEKWQYLAVKKLFALLYKTTSKDNGDFHCLNCLHSFTAENRLKNHVNVCRNCYYCYIEIPKEDNKILKYYHGSKFVKAPFIIFSDIEPFLKKVDTYHNKSKKSIIIKKHKYEAPGYSLFSRCSSDIKIRKVNYYR